MKNHVQKFSFPRLGLFTLSLFLTGLLLFNPIAQQAAHGQCCLVDSLNISTGYNPSTGSEITSGLPIDDPKWKIGTYTSFLSGEITATPDVPLTGSALIISPPSGSGWASTPGWISCDTAASFFCTAGPGSGILLQNTFTRTFNLCDSGCIEFKMNVLDDYLIAGITVSGHGSIFAGQAAGPVYYTTPQTIHPSCIPLSAGAHTITVTMTQQDNGPSPDNIGLNLQGEIYAHPPGGGTAVTSSLVSESSACSTYTCADLYIVLPPTCLPNGTSSCEASIGPGTWSISPTTVATINSTTGAATPVSSGTATVTYTMACGDTVTGILHIYPAPTFTISPTDTTICAGQTMTVTGTMSHADSMANSFGVGWSPASSCGSCGYDVITPVTTETVTAGVYLLYTDPEGGGAGCSLLFQSVINVIPYPGKPSVPVPINICPGSSATVTATSSDPGYTPTYTWSPSTSLSATTGSTVIADPSNSTTYIVTAKNGSCPTGSSDTFIVHVDSVTIAHMPPFTTCTGDTDSLKATTTDATSYHWTGPGGYSYTSTTSPATTITPTATGVYIYTLTASNSYSCSATAYDTVTVNQTPPKPSVSGTFTICPGTTTTITATYSGTLTPTYTWGEATGTGLLCTSCNPTTITPSVTGTYFVYATTTGCPSKNDTFTITTLPPPTVSGAAASPSTICAGQSSTFTVTVTGATRYSWTGPGGFSYTSTTTPTTSVTPSVTGTLIYTFAATSAAGCITTATVTLTVNPLPGLPSVAGSFSVCAGGTTTLTATATASTTPTYTWGEITGTGLLCTSCNPTTITPSVTGTYFVYASALSCPGKTDTFTVTVHPLPVISSIGEDTAVCSGTAVTFSLTATVSGASTYAWSGPGSYTSTLLNNMVTTSPTVTGTYTLIATSSYGCPATGTMTVTVHPLPPVSPIVAIPDTVCITDSTHLTDATTGGVWSISSDTVATIDAGGYVTGISGGEADISYTVTNIYGCTSTATKYVTVIPHTSAGVITGEDSLCKQSLTSLFDSVSGGTWSISSDTVATVDGSGNVYGVQYGSAVVSYTVSNGYCSSVATDSVFVVHGPTLPLIVGPDTACILETALYTDSYPGGSWFSYTTGIADIDSTTGLLTGASSGTAVIAYDVTSICGTTEITDTIHIIPAVPPITGISELCSGSSTTLSDMIGGGTWSSSNPAIASVNATTGVVTGVTTGMTTISYIATDMCGTFTATFTMAVNTQPFITTNFIVACQSLAPFGDGGGGTTYILSDTTGCIEVCDSTVVRYYANGVDSSVFTWSVTGGTIVHSYPGNDSIDIQWPAAGTTASLSLSDTFNHCIGSYDICIQVIQRPHADFAPSSYSACSGSTVVFTDLSTADLLSPIVSWYWNFGDGTTSGLENPTHTFYVGNPHTPVILAVKNACNCSDTFLVLLNINPAPGPAVSCPSIVCDSQSANYSLSPASCPHWSVIGGAITAGSGTPNITVDWNNIGTSGFGYVKVSDTCATCPDTTTIQIPVVLTNATISGPDTICAGIQYEYTLPLWPATQYMWGVLGAPSAKVGYNNDYKLVVDFTTGGTYTIHGWYQNTIALCGGNVDKTITVVSPATIAGSTDVCNGATETYSLSGTLSGSWNLSDFEGSVIATGTGNSIAYTFTTTGTYMLTATGSFCADPLLITVLLSPPHLDSVKGPDTVCLNHVYNYTAYTNKTGMTYNWQITGGTVVPGSGSATVSVIWTSTGTKQLSVERVSTEPPYCTGPDTTINVIQEVVDPNIAGDTAPCVNAYRTYTTTYTRGDVYDWSITPNTAGSVASGNHTLSADVLWNNATGPTYAGVVLTVYKCDTIVSDTFHVHLNTSETLSVSGSPNPGCPGAPVTFTATTGGGTYTWYFGDGASAVTDTNVTTHAFLPNSSDTNESYEVAVTALPNINAFCPTSGTAYISEELLPGPLASAGAAPINICGGTSSTLTGYGSYAVDTFTYQWYDNGSPVSGATNATYTTTTAANYTVKITADNGCSGISPVVTVTADCSGGSGSVTPCSTVTPTATTSGSCNTITLTGHVDGGSTGYKWTFLGNGTVLGTSSTETFTYGAPGVYDFEYDEYFGSSCYVDAVVSGIIPIGPNFIDGIRCSVNDSDTVSLHDNTAYLGATGPTSFTWTVDGTAAGSGKNLSLRLPAGATYTVTETVGGCPVTRDITIPALPTGHAAFTFTVSPICSGVPISFTPIYTAGTVAYDWNFGDFSSSLLESPQRVYTYNGLLAFNIYSVTLTVTDTIGCTADTTEAVQIQKNTLNGGLGSNKIVCASNAPVTLTWDNLGPTTPVSYLWSNGSTSSSSISVDTSGAYWVTVTDAYQCQGTFPTPAVEIEIVPAVTAQINGDQTYCVGDVVELSCFTDSGTIYKWFRNGTADGTASSVADADLPAGAYQYMLVVTSIADTVSCPDTLTDSIQIYPLPSAPVITGPAVVNCNTYQLQLTATDSTSGTYNWSDGTTGTTDNIYTGGDYEVWFTDLEGCINSATVDVPQAPGNYFGYFPSGCYTLCNQQLPLTFYGIPDVSFHLWDWIFDTTVVDSGVGPMTPYLVNSAGTYSWELNNGLCSQASGTMDITTSGCSQCGTPPTATLTCESGNPSSYQINITLYSVAAGSTYTLGTNLGPIAPFSGTMPGTGPYPLTLTYTMLSSPPPSNIEVEALITLPTGGKCFQEVKIAVPACAWESERIAGGDSSAVTSTVQNINMSSAMLIYPNPTSGALTISYDYGEANYSQRSLAIYDETGRLLQQTGVTDVHGNWQLNTGSWTPGIYIVRMEGDGTALQTQRVAVTH